MITLESNACTKYLIGGEGMEANQGRRIKEREKEGETDRYLVPKLITSYHVLQGVLASLAEDATALIPLDSSVGNPTAQHSFQKTECNLMPHPAGKMDNTVPVDIRVIKKFVLVIIEIFIGSFGQGNSKITRVKAVSNPLVDHRLDFRVTHPIGRVNN